MGFEPYVISSLPPTLTELILILTGASSALAAALDDGYHVLELMGFKLGVTCSALEDYYPIDYDYGSWSSDDYSF